MGVVQMTLPMSLDGFITGPDPGEKQPLGAGGGAVLRPGGAPWMVDEVLGASGAVVVGRAMHDHVQGGGTDPPFKMPVFVERTGLTEGEPTTHLRFRVLR
jgi:hypothetical protein